jgi:hypothetical protein
MPRSAVNTQPGKRWQQILPKLLGNQGGGYYLVALSEILADAAYMWLSAELIARGSLMHPFHLLSLRSDTAIEILFTSWDRKNTQYIMNT